MVSAMYTFESLHKSSLASSFCIKPEESKLKMNRVPQSKEREDAQHHPMHVITVRFTFQYSHGAFRRLSLCDIEVLEKYIFAFDSFYQRWRPQLFSEEHSRGKWRESIVLSSPVFLALRARRLGLHQQLTTYIHVGKNFDRGMGSWLAIKPTKTFYTTEQST